MATRITFNGQEYNSPDEMPPQVRQLYERVMADLSQNQQNSFSSPKVNIKVNTNLRFKYNGQIYNNLDELPPEVRARYANIVDRVDKDHDGIPDFLEGKANFPVSLSSSTNPETNFGPSAPIAPPSQTPPVISSDQPTRRLLVLAGIIIFLLLIAVIILVGSIYVR